MKNGFKLNGQRGEVMSVLVASLILDDSIYPRAWHSKEQVERLQEAVRAGITLPPILVDKATLRVVDGRHRYLRAVQDGDESMLADVVAFPDEQAIFEAAIAANAKHGYSYFEIDHEHIYRRAATLNISTERIAHALCVTVEKVEAATRGFAKVGLNGKAGIEPSVAKPKIVKPHLATHASRGVASPGARTSLGIPGTDYLQCINQLVVGIENRKIDYRRDRITYAMHRLAELIQAHVPKHPPV